MLCHLKLVNYVSTVQPLELFWNVEEKWMNTDETHTRTLWYSITHIPEYELQKEINKPIFRNYSAINPQHF
jgi:hypothetical protein